MYSMLKRHISLIATFVVCMIVVGFLQFSGPGLAGNDGYYHIAMASLVWDQGLPVAFPYLEFTLLDQAHFVDTHMLFHVFQAPFTAFLDLETAAKLSSSIFIALAFSLFVWLLKQYDIPYPLFWALLLLVSSESFLYRMMMPRPPIFALIYTWLAFHFLMQRKFVLLAVIACLFTWTYKSFFILFPMACIAMLVFYVANKEVNFKPLLAVGTGVVAGLLINPFFPDNIFFLVDALRMKIFAGGFNIAVGNEWYPFKTLTLLKDSAIPLAAYLVGIVLTNRDEWKADPHRLFWFLLATLWLLMVFKSRRFIEFFPPAALLFFIFAMKPWAQRFSWASLYQRRVWWFPAVLMVLLLGLAGYKTLHGEYQKMQKKAPVNAYQGGALWLAKHTPAGSTVFHTDWDDFPRLFFHNRHNHYIVGLDPDYMRLKDAARYDLWKRISKGKIKHPADLIRNQFGAEYVFTDKKHKRFIKIAKRSPRMKLVFSDKYSMVYRVQ
ncbi:MAG: hypothetical protein Q9M16_08655 [Mariprofundus sp.]|nr:hypothetical protein [Mariprofundus sp.]